MTTLLPSLSLYYLIWGLDGCMRYCFFLIHNLLVHDRSSPDVMIYDRACSKHALLHDTDLLVTWKLTWYYSIHLQLFIHHIYLIHLNNESYYFILITFYCQCCFWHSHIDHSSLSASFLALAVLFYKFV